MANLGAIGVGRGYAGGVGRPGVLTSTGRSQIGTTYPLVRSLSGKGAGGVAPTVVAGPPGPPGPPAAPAPSPTPAPAPAPVYSAYVSQLNAEVASSGIVNAVISQFSAEVVNRPVSAGAIKQVAIEVLGRESRAAISQFNVEVVRPYMPPIPPEHRITQIALEILGYPCEMHAGIVAPTSTSTIPGRLTNNEFMAVPTLQPNDVAQYTVEIPNGATNIHLIMTGGSDEYRNVYIRVGTPPVKTNTSWVFDDGTQGNAEIDTTYTLPAGLWYIAVEDDFRSNAIVGAWIKVSWTPPPNDGYNSSGSNLGHFISASSTYTPEAEDNACTLFTALQKSISLISAYEAELLVDYHNGLANEIHDHRAVSNPVLGSWQWDGIERNPIPAVDGVYNSGDDVGALTISLPGYVAQSDDGSLTLQVALQRALVTIRDYYFRTNDRNTLNQRNARLVDVSTGANASYRAPTNAFQIAYDDDTGGHAFAAWRWDGVQRNATITAYAPADGDTTSTCHVGTGDKIDVVSNNATPLSPQPVTLQDAIAQAQYAFDHSSEFGGLHSHNYRLKVSDGTNAILCDNDSGSASQAGTWTWDGQPCPTMSGTTCGPSVVVAQIVNEVLISSASFSTDGGTGAEITQIVLETLCPTAQLRDLHGGFT